MFFTRIAGLLGRSSSSSTVFSHQPQNVLRALAPSMISPAGVIAASPSSRIILSPLLPSLSPAAYQLTQVRTFRDKDVLKLRCNACYFKKEDDRWWVLCSKHPRHKQRAKVEDHRLKWIVTHITRTGSYRRKHFQYAHQDI
ncbi:54S ribosomal protein L36, mitochondrial [Tyrophagus putrescentiae]|nr:54S ribosomal protein L36, mitochondrial [Tyrophagus putrescentiae]